MEKNKDNTVVLSVIVLAKNEEDKIKGCLTSLADVKTPKEVIVVDDDSSDQTASFARKAGARVVRHALNGDFSQQRNWSMDQARGRWIFYLDADERITPALAKEIDTFIEDARGVTGVYFKRIDWFGGRWLRHGEIGAVRLLRLAKKDNGQWRKPVDEVWEIRDGSTEFSYPLLHYSHPDLTQFLESINDRSTANAQALYRLRSTISWYDWGKPLAKFVVNYIFRLGFLDGLSGFVFAVLMSFHSFLVRGKLYLLIKKNHPDRVLAKGPSRKLLLFWLSLVSANYFRGIAGRLLK